MKKLTDKLQKKWVQPTSWWVREFSARRPITVLSSVMAFGVIAGIGGGLIIGRFNDRQLHSQVKTHKAELQAVQQHSQLEINALAARLAKLQAQTNRLNALGERLTQMGQLQDGEFKFDQPVGVGDGGDTPSQDMPLEELTGGMAILEKQLNQSGQQLSVLESLLFNQELQKNMMPSRNPIDTYITSHFGGRADPFGNGSQFHAGIDFHANVGDPVLAVAGGMVVFSDVNSGYGNMVDIDHGNGYVTRYAHNSRLLVKEGDIIRPGQEIAKAGSTGRSTGAHVHFEVWENGVAVNPRKFLADNKVATPEHS